MNYPCRHPGCSEASVWFAVNNAPELGHVCNKHFEQLTACEKSNYAQKGKPLIHDGQRLIGAKRGNYSIKTYDDGYGKLYIHRDSLGVSGIVRASSLEDAYGICEDEFFPEATETVEELINEYGFDRKHVTIIKPRGGGPERPATMDDFPITREQFVRWETRETPNPDVWTENGLFQEAFGFRPNGPNATDKLNHGIYSKDLNGDLLEVLTAELARELEIELVIETDEEEYDQSTPDEAPTGGEGC